MVLVDTSIWIEFFRAKPTVFLPSLDLLILEREIATCLVIYAEICSGQMKKGVKSLVSSAFQSMYFIDEDWSMRSARDMISDMAQKAYQENIPACGIVDRMIVLSAKKNNLPLWSLDQKMIQLAKSQGVTIFRPSEVP